LSSYRPAGAAAWRLALVAILQFREDLSDRRAADAVRDRIDWESLLGLELTDRGFDDSVLCEFRSRLLAGGGEGLLLDKMLLRFNRALRPELSAIRGRRGPSPVL
jgi:transposase